MPNSRAWPKLPDVAANDPQGEVKKTLLQGQIELCRLERQYELEREKLELQAQIDEQRAFWDNEFKLLQAVHSAYFDVAKGQLDRVAASAEFVQKSASVIATIYTGILGLSFVVNGHGTALLPPQGIVPGVFLGLSVVLATGFRAYITKSGSVPEPRPNPLIPVGQRERRNTFIKWAKQGAVAHRYWLQAAVISLGFGVASLPLPYLPLPGSVSLGIVLGGLVLTFGLPWKLSSR